MTTCIDHGRVGDKDGYLITHRSIDGVRSKVRLHRYVFYQTYGYWPNTCRHTCDNPRCINPAHLIDGTPADNSRDMVLRARSLKGTKHHRAKLTEQDVYTIRSRYEYKSADNNSFTLAKEFGVSQHLIMRILKNKVWSHV